MQFKVESTILFYFSSASRRPGDPCMANEFQCRSVQPLQCVPMSYQCDGQIDCSDRSDEIGCSKYMYYLFDLHHIFFHQKRLNPEKVLGLTEFKSSITVQLKMKDYRTVCIMYKNTCIHKVSVFSLYCATMRNLILWNLDIIYDYFLYFENNLVITFYDDVLDIYFIFLSKLFEHTSAPSQEWLTVVGDVLASAATLSTKNDINLWKRGASIVCTAHNFFPCTRLSVCAARPISM